MSNIQVILPDGAKIEVPRGTTPAEIARKISPGLAKDALVARIKPASNGATGELVDLSRPLEQDVQLAILTRKDPEAIQVFRHSAAHLLAAAVLELFPNVKLGIGPPIDYGFFYEFLREEPFTPEDLALIEAKMHELASQDIPNERKLLPKTEALDLYRKWNQSFKCELVLFDGKQAPPASAHQAQREPSASGEQVYERVPLFDSLPQSLGPPAFLFVLWCHRVRTWSRRLLDWSSFEQTHSSISFFRNFHSLPAL